jgi:hypothetical protein
MFLVLKFQDESQNRYKRLLVGYPLLEEEQEILLFELRGVI